MENIGEMSRHRDVNGRGANCQDRLFFPLRRSRDALATTHADPKWVYGISETGLRKNRFVRDRLALPRPYRASHRRDLLWLCTNIKLCECC
jgi:hypothetical protein